MIYSEILHEKNRIQAQLSEESGSAREYLICAHIAARDIAMSYGFKLQYAELPGESLREILKTKIDTTGRTSP